MLSDAIEKAQKKIESNNFAIRKNLLEYDQVMNEQRELIYKQRRRVLEGENMRSNIIDMIHGKIDEVVGRVASDDVDKTDWDLNELNSLLLPVIPLLPVTEADLDEVKKANDLSELLKTGRKSCTRKKNGNFRSRRLSVRLSGWFCFGSLIGSGWSRLTIWNSFGRESAAGIRTAKSGG